MAKTSAKTATKLTPVVVEAELQIAAETEGKEAEAAITVYNQMQIATQADLEFAGQTLREVVLKKKSLIDMRTRATKPMSTALEEVRSWFRKPVKALERFETAIKKSIVDAQKASFEKQRVSLEAAGEASLRGDHEAAGIAMAQASKHELTAVAGVSMRQSWDFEITDMAKVPLKYMVVNEKMVKDEIRAAAGAVKIPGIKVVQNTSVAAMTK
jgi:hypothetical protein